MNGGDQSECVVYYAVGSGNHAKGCLVEIGRHPRKGVGVRRPTRWLLSRGAAAIFSSKQEASSCNTSLNGTKSTNIRENQPKNIFTYRATFLRFPALNYSRVSPHHPREIPEKPQHGTSCSGSETWRLLVMPRLYKPADFSALLERYVDTSLFSRSAWTTGRDRSNSIPSRHELIRTRLSSLCRTASAWQRDSTMRGRRVSKNGSGNPRPLGPRNNTQHLYACNP